MQAKHKLLILFLVFCGLLSCRTLSSTGSGHSARNNDDLLRYYQKKPEFNAPSLSMYFSEEKRLNEFFDDRKDSAAFAPFLDSMRLQYPIEWEYVDHLVRYIQENIVYEKYNPGEDIKYPWETFAEGSGVCSDQSILLGKLLIYSGYKIVLFTFPEAEHIAVGVRVPEKYGSYKTEFVYIETTNIRPLGDIPYDSFEDDALDNPKIITIEKNGENSFTSVGKLMKHYMSLSSKYGKDFLYLDQKSRFLSMRIDRLQSVVDSLKNNLDEMQISYEKMHQELTANHNRINEMGCNGVVDNQELYEKCAQFVKKYNLQVEEVNHISKDMERESGITNLLVMELNKLVNEYNAHIEKLNSR